ncbi:flagellar motor switch protein FliN [candidate division WOR-1 bacterium RIFOXYB2_FULL_42_35]|uniref:Flagellar motor switch protein FliN n=1 Tax=candidate division WOR-1 bacterium RIFOXYC2_FULL_41_25 TaxID=1802586 RepID=A0A1F4TIJ4_UNCSA|nr:MAG: flagellar motor switch protein FliN [candidate division WOR-1 bacterium RIFOXYA2_FULL_41_14]OGC21567.1 MAG: flagellar motor switch protein FliN [candidate division WOR-1 bacterium RIFOXYB2_FULL_42_35]OGC32545.1 MAG: flagellar motor switch protein FliN [candidate division WOR-1 bacterium RIFOXYC2_FULL_41_25]OGC42226.1 MAG: flagellar motor switch protein FliN [candidate division WOR-1 bacterium RIFOXYD2_FULL_41_8]
MDVKNVNFPEFSEEGKGEKVEQKALGNIPVQATVELGQTELSLKDILELAEGSIVELNRLAGEPLDLKVGGQLVAQGEVVAIDDYYGLRITNVVMR